MSISLNKGGVAKRDGKEIGQWHRRYNGKVDRGVKQGDWVGLLPNGVGVTKAKKKDLCAWFDANTLKEGQADG